MEIPVEFLEKFRPRARKSGEPRNERDEMLDIFLARLNASRIKDGYPKISYARLAKLLERIPTRDLYAFYQKCETYRSFGAGFHYELKPKAA